MAQKEKKKTPRRKQKDPGFLPGMAAGSFVLIVWALVALQPDGTATPAPAGGGAAPSVSESGPQNASGEPAGEASTGRPAPEVAYSVPPWKQDERWTRAGELGEDALDRIEKEFKRHEEEGDPFRFRAEMDECRKQIEKAVQLLEELASDYQDDPVAQHSIETRSKRFQKNLRATRK